MLEMVSGRIRQFTSLPGAIDPTPGYHSHEDDHHLEYFVFDPRQTRPVAVVHWRAIATNRGAILEAGIPV